jgi:hypothetical protein
MFLGGCNPWYRCDLCCMIPCKGKRKKPIGMPSPSSDRRLALVSRVGEEVSRILSSDCSHQQSADPGSLSTGTVRHIRQLLASVAEHYLVPASPLVRETARLVVSPTRIYQGFMTVFFSGRRWYVLSTSENLESHFFAALVFVSTLNCEQLHSQPYR